MNKLNQDISLLELAEIVSGIESRLSKIESQLHPGRFSQPEEESEIIPVIKETEDEIELRIGERWFAKIGIVAFLFSVFFLLILRIENFPQMIQIFAGYLIASIMILISYWKNEKLGNLANYLLGGGFIILYFSTLRLHFFGTEPLIESLSVLSITLYVICICIIAASVLRHSPYLTALSFTLVFTTALLSDNGIILFSSLLIISSLSAYFSNRYEWDGLLIFSIPLTLLTHLLWFLGNPILNGTININLDYQLTVLFIPLYSAIYGFGRVKSFESEAEEPGLIIKTFLNSALTYMLFLFILLKLENELNPLFSFGMALLFISLAAFYWRKQNSRIITFIYSMVAYGALSTAIVLNFGSPNYYFWLCWQSVVVVSTALWFRSKFIVVANFFIFLVIVIASFASGNGYEAASLNFGIVALISARVMNWQKDRLELESEYLRNSYLIIALLTIPYVLYNILPAYFIGISWIFLALTYYIIGKILNIKKYRLMATATLFMSLIYIFIFGLTSGDTGYKIISFLLVSIALIFISIVYSRVKAKEKQN
ncbi:MAG: DUF2339 domain-containing protein [Ignavibacteria bacterium]|nr:DUF2339 domain-containing protein [Ignavibacteria bacterium]